MTSILLSKARDLWRNYTQILHDFIQSIASAYIMDISELMVLPLDILISL